jgi:hypothetical protein
MLTIRAMTNGEGYAAKHLAHSDYYAEGERITGQWFGRGAALLALSGPVEYKNFGPFFSHCHGSGMRTIFNHNVEARNRGDFSASRKNHLR